MSRIRTILALSVIALSMSACSRPFVFFPGGQLAGEVAPPPADWSFTDEISTIQIETNPADPYSVNIWVLELEGALYLHAGANRAAWVEHLEADPRLRIKVDETIYELVSARVTDADEFARFAEKYEEKYGGRPRNENIAEIYLLRLTNR
ncbi:MAG: hypothetical protein CL931_13550 [Deltaproteobacteria bacterium]|nr:hypothetical protein [Deltaproteobacteria bacterium]